jgi:gamma-glutamyl phosphate reductase
LLIIFESRPDCLPQIAALALRSGNGLLLKGGKEAEKSNKILHKIIAETIEKVTKGFVSRNVIGLITSRASIPSLLKMDSYIDLVIPRGSGDLVKHIKENTRIPVMGHAEGVCHVYIDSKADINKAEKILLDSKTDYPSACNAAETLLLHEDTLSNGMADKLVRALRVAGVSLYGSEKAMSKGLTEKQALNMNNEYGDLSITIEIVNSVQEAIDHIHKFGSSHTECIVTEDKKTAEFFLKSVDSACVFHNASTRFADGFRFGLGAEVGISTGRIHARGPVGVEGLLTTKWELRSSSNNGHTVSSFSGSNPQCVYTHKNIL